MLAPLSSSRRTPSSQVAAGGTGRSRQALPSRTDTMTASFAALPLLLPPSRKRMPPISQPRGGHPAQHPRPIQTRGEKLRVSSFIFFGPIFCGLGFFCFGFAFCFGFFPLSVRANFWGVNIDFRKISACRSHIVLSSEHLVGLLFWFLVKMRTGYYSRGRCLRRTRSLFTDLQ